MAESDNQTRPRKEMAMSVKATNAAVLFVILSMLFSSLAHIDRKNGF
jgi:hypothetical protein